MLKLQKPQISPRTKNKQVKKILGVKEPKRQSTYDLIVKNLKNVGRNTFLQRFIYTGELGSIIYREKVICFLSDSVSKINTNSLRIEPLTGFLLVYSHHFVHIIEGDEDGIRAHLSLLLVDQIDEFQSLFRTVKVLITLTHISERFCTNWNHYYGVPKQLLNPIDLDCSLNDVSSYLFSCIGRLYELIERFTDSSRRMNDSKGTELSLEGGSMHGKDSAIRLRASMYGKESAIRLRASMYGKDAAVRLSTAMYGKGSAVRLDESMYGNDSALKLGDSVRSSRIYLSGSKTSRSSFFYPYRDFLPEAEILEFFIKSDATETLMEYFLRYEVSQRNIYDDIVWPVPIGLVLYDIFDSEYNRPVEMLIRPDYRKPSKSVLNFSRSEASEGDLL